MQQQPLDPLGPGAERSQACRKHLQEQGNNAFATNARACRHSTAPAGSVPKKLSKCDLGGVVMLYLAGLPEEVLQEDCQLQTQSRRRRERTAPIAERDIAVG